jgi:hypothetical protein
MLKKDTAQNKWTYSKSYTEGRKKIKQAIYAFLPKIYRQKVWACFMIVFIKARYIKASELIGYTRQGKSLIQYFAT